MKYKESKGKGRSGKGVKRIFFFFGGGRVGWKEQLIQESFWAVADLKEYSMILTTSFYDVNHERIFIL